MSQPYQLLIHPKPQLPFWNCPIIFNFRLPFVIFWGFLVKELLQAQFLIWPQFSCSAQKFISRQKRKNYVAIFLCSRLKSKKLWRKKWPWMKLIKSFFFVKWWKQRGYKIVCVWVWVWVGVLGGERVWGERKGAWGCMSGVRVRGERKRVCKQRN